MEGHKSEEQEEDLDSDVREQLNEREEEIRAYLLRGEALSEETIEKYTAQFWHEEPYRYCCNPHHYNMYHSGVVVIFTDLVYKFCLELY